MSPHPSLEILKQGLSALKETVKKRKDGLTARLRKKEKISDADAAWLDNEGNVVEEDAVIDKLEKASDYERGYARLDTKEVGLVDNLRKLAEGLGQKAAEMVSKKRKSA
jgi:hypothetical protein